ncbi:hypothetical protein MLD38_004640 [Melastoma candidum]|uniref:Uncharacterized protein n=1 Tax=Melastoma candidum TaxID=119954 RepID=A0ACB9SB02_9MYRT|nr:hypothetical protein MLD38_004640 [Melastoma candidum]
MGPTKGPSRNILLGLGPCSGKIKNLVGTRKSGPSDALTSDKKNPRKSNHRGNLLEPFAPFPFGLVQSRWEILRVFRLESQQRRLTRFPFPALAGISISISFASGRRINPREESIMDSGLKETTGKAATSSSSLGDGVNEAADFQV